MEFTFINGDEELVIRLSKADLNSVGIKNSELFGDVATRERLLHEILDTHEVGIFNDESQFVGHYEAGVEGEFIFILSKKGTNNMRPDAQEILDMFQDFINNGSESESLFYEKSPVDQDGHKRVIIGFADFDNLVKAANSVIFGVNDIDNVELSSDLFTFQGRYLLILDYFIRVFSEENVKKKVNQIDNQVSIISEYGDVGEFNKDVVRNEGRRLLKDHAIQTIANHFN